MERSTVVDDASGGSVLHDIRTSSGTFLATDADAVVTAVQQRIAELSMIPHANQESMQVLRYGVGERYGAHMDAFDDTRLIGLESGLQRIATALLFLNTPEEGGETTFPNVPVPDQGAGWSECARGSLAHKPKTGDLILFWNLTPAGEMDLGATHEACPVIRGEKWSAPLWMHQAPFRPQPAKLSVASPDGVAVADDADACLDQDTACAGWARAGECERNPAFMIGVPGEFVGRCRVSCAACPHPRQRAADIA